MSLNWDVSKIEDEDFKWVLGANLFDGNMPRGYDADKHYLNPKLEAIIWATMAVDMGEITTANKVEFYLRYILWQRLHSYDLYFSFKDVEKAVGLKTNVHTATNAAFKKDLWERRTKELTKLINDGNYDSVGE